MATHLANGIGYCDIILQLPFLNHILHPIYEPGKKCPLCDCNSTILHQFLLLLLHTFCALTVVVSLDFLCRRFVSIIAFRHSAKALTGLAASIIRFWVSGFYRTLGSRNVRRDSHPSVHFKTFRATTKESLYYDEFSKATLNKRGKWSILGNTHIAVWSNITENHCFNTSAQGLRPSENINQPSKTFVQTS